MYLLDEFENLTEAQQRYVNTLSARKGRSMHIQDRLTTYGVKTQVTLSGDAEENKQDSEFEILPLDVRLRKNPEQYRQFAKRLFVKRLTERGYISPSEGATGVGIIRGAALVENADEGVLAENLTSFVWRSTPTASGRTSKPYESNSSRALIMG